MIIADTSVIVKLVIPEARSDIALRLRAQGIAAPALWAAEAGNVLWRKQRVGILSKNEALRLFGILLNGPIVSLPFESEAQTALELACELDHPVYDCFFLAAAISENTHLVTDDARFASAVRRHAKWRSRLQMLADL